MSVTTVSLQLRMPPEQVGRWTEHGGPGALNNPSDSAYLRAVWSFRGNTYSANVPEAYHAYPNVLDDGVGEIIAIRVRCRARFEMSKGSGYIWLGDFRHGAMFTRIGKFRGSHWQEMSSAWRTTNYDGNPWTDSELARWTLLYIGRTDNTVPMRLSRVWVDIQRATTPKPTILKPPSLVTNTSNPDVAWRNDDESFRQAGWQAKVYLGTWSSRPSTGLVAEGGSVYTGPALDRRHRSHHAWRRGKGRKRGLYKKLLAASAVRWRIDRSLDPAETYTVFVRIARPWGKRPLWSAWAHKTFKMAAEEEAPPDPDPPEVDPPPDPLDPIPPDPDDLILLPAEIDARAFALRVSWPGQQVGFGLGPFGLMPFGGGLSLIQIESTDDDPDDDDPDWVERGTFEIGVSEFIDPFAPFNATRWYRIRAGIEFLGDVIYSRRSAPIAGTLTYPRTTATISSVATNEAVQVYLQGLPLTPTLRNRMQVMAAADLDVSTAQGQLAQAGYRGTLWAEGESDCDDIEGVTEFERLLRLLTDPGVLVWRDANRYKFPFVWDADMRVVPQMGKLRSPHAAEVQMTVVSFPQGVH